MDYRQKRNEKIKTLIPQPIKGKGLLNDTINNLPFELHVPGYKYLGPGTRLAKKLEKGVKPKNALDELAMHHDIAYSKSNNLKDRHQADYALQEGAWKRVKAKDAGFGEKTAAWLTTNAMKAKRALGAGVLTKYPVTLADDQQAKLSTAIQQGKAVNLTVSRHRSKDSVINETYLPLSRYQIQNIKKGKCRIKLSAAQLKKIKSGGFLPLPILIAAAPAAASAISSLSDAYSKWRTNDKLVEEQIRHNKAIEEQKRGTGVVVASSKRKPRKRKGAGIYVNKKPKQGDGLYINKKAPAGNGLLTELLKKKKTLR